MKSSTSIVNAGIMALIVLGIAQGVVWWGGVTLAEDRSLNDSVGQEAAAVVAFGGTRVLEDADSQPLYTVLSGTCRFVVVYDPTCGACQVRARQWYRDLIVLADPNDPDPFPAGWAAIWVSVRPDDTLEELERVQFPALIMHASAPIDFMNELGVSGFPSHFVLDKRGVVVSAGLGAPLGPKHAYHSTCTFRADG